MVKNLSWLKSPSVFHWWLSEYWEVGHTQYVISQLLHVRFQPDDVRLVGLGFKKINPLVTWMSPSGCRVMKEKLPFSVLTDLDSVCQPIKTATKINKKNVKFDRFSENISFWWIICLFDCLEAGKSKTKIFPGCDPPLSWPDPCRYCGSFVPGA